MTTGIYPVQPRNREPERTGIMRHLVTMAILAGLLTGCGSREQSELEAHTIPFSGQTKLWVHNFTGNTLVYESGLDDEIRIEAVKRISNRMGVGGAGKRMSDITVVVSEDGGVIDITARYPLRSVWRYSVDFNITVPAGMELDIDVGDGNAFLDVTSRKVSIDVGNGNATANLALADNCSVYIGVGNGDVTLSIPPQTGAALDAQVGHGTISTTGMNIRDRVETPDQLKGLVGTGGGSIRLLTGNGNIDVRPLQ